MEGSHHTGPLLDSGKALDREWFSEMPVWGDPDYVHFMDDFTGIAVNITNDWTQVEDAAATAEIEADTVGGRILLSTPAADDEGTSLQGNEIFRVATGRNIWFEMQCQISDITQTDFCTGLTVNFATNPEAILTAADRIVFQKNDGDAGTILCKTEKNGTETSTDSQKAFVAATDIKLGFRVVGTGLVFFYVDRVWVATHTTNIPDDENLAAAVFILAGEVGAKTLAVDYISVVMSR